MESMSTNLLLLLFSSMFLCSGGLLYSTSMASPGSPSFAHHPADSFAASSYRSSATKYALSSSCNGSISIGELAALEALYNSTNGAEWNWDLLLPPSTKWKFPATVSEPCADGWQGVGCNRTNSPSTPTNTCVVESLVLQSFNLRGPLPPQISSLFSLSTLDLYINSLTNTIPVQLYSMTALEFLRLRQNSLNGTIASAISTLSRLKILFYESNLLSGQIPTELCEINTLETLDLGSNSLISRIPDAMSKLTNLDGLFLFNNSLTNTIPSTLSSLSRIQILSLLNNSLVGSIPSQITKLTTLIGLDLGLNRLTSTIPSGLSAFTSTDFFYLDLSRNSFVGTVPSDMSALKDLLFLYLQENQLEGPLSPIFSGYSRLLLLYVQSNQFSGQLPDLQGLSSLQVLDISKNLFGGSLSPSLSYLKSNLLYFAAQENFFTGSPFFFLGFPKLSYLNASSNRFSGDIPNSESLVTFRLKYLDISNNELVGSLPSWIDSMFPSLQLLSASRNCLFSYIPSSLQNIPNLTTLLLNAIGRCPTSSETDEYSILNVNSRKFYTIPSRLLALPRLVTAQFISNELYGTLGDIGPSLQSLSVVGNRIVGDIPTSIQTSSSLNQLALSLNRLSGTLINDAFKHMPLDSIIDLYSNRISGDIPTSFDYFDTPADILTGNVFYCQDQGAPSNLKNHENYSCGSSSIDFYGYIYATLGIPFLSIIVYLYHILNKQRLFSNGIHPFRIYFKSRPFPSALFRGLFSQEFQLACFVISVVLILYNLIYTYSHNNETLPFNDTYSTVTDRYGWTVSFMYVHGFGAFFMLFLALAALLYCYLHYFETSFGYYAHVSNKKVDPSAYLTSSQSTPSSFVTKIIESVKNVYDKIISVTETGPKRGLILLQLVNIAVITFVNVLYVLSETSTQINSTYKKIFPIVLSIFKMFWINYFVVNMTKYGLQNKLSLKRVFYNYLFALVYVNILVPLLTVYFTDSLCLYFVLFPDRISEISYDLVSLEPSVSCPFVGSTVVCQEPTFTSVLSAQRIKPSFIYGFDCGNRILTSYVPAVLSGYTIKGIILPVVKLIILSHPTSSGIRNSIIGKSLLPYSINALSEENLGNVEDREFRTFQYLNNLISDLLNIFTYGLLCPFLMVLILFSILMNEFIDHLQIGSYVYDMTRKIDQEKIEEGLGLGLDLTAAEVSVLEEIVDIDSLSSDPISGSGTTTAYATSSNSSDIGDKKLDKTEVAVVEDVGVIVGASEDVEKASVAPVEASSDDVNKKKKQRVRSSILGLCLNEDNSNSGSNTNTNSNTNSSVTSGGVGTKMKRKTLAELYIEEVIEKKSEQSHDEYPVVASESINRHQKKSSEISTDDSLFRDSESSSSSSSAAASSSILDGINGVFSSWSNSRSNTTVVASKISAITSSKRRIGRRQSLVDLQFGLVARIYMDNTHTLLKAVWKPMLLIILFSLTLILFDIIADLYYNTAGALSVVFFWIIIYVFFQSRDRLEFIIMSIKRRKSMHELWKYAKTSCNRVLAGLLPSYCSHLDVKGQNPGVIDEDSVVVGVTESSGNRSNSSRSSSYNRSSINMEIEMQSNPILKAAN